MFNEHFQDEVMLRSNIAFRIHDLHIEFDMNAFISAF